MPSLQNLKESDLRGLLTAQSLSRARGYVRWIKNEVRSGPTLSAQVPGSDGHEYEVEIDVRDSGIAAFCTCPYDWGGYCKHIGAVLLKWIANPGAFSTADSTSAADPPPLEVTAIDPPATQRPAEPPWWITSSLSDRLQYDLEELASFLTTVKLQDLRQMSRNHGWKVSGNRKADVIEQMVTHLTDPGEVLQITYSLDEEHRRVLRAMVLLGDYPRTRPEKLERVASIWGDLTSYKQIQTYTRHLCEAGLAVPADASDDYYSRTDFVPDAIARLLPPMLADRLPGADAAVGGVNVSAQAPELRLSDPYALVRSASQLVLLLEQSPSPLRAPMPRPHLEKFHPQLEEWDYDPHELAELRKRGQLTPYSEATLTVPPPLYSLPEDAIQRLSPVVGDAERLEFLFSLLVAGGIFQSGSPVTVWSEVKRQFLRQDELTQRSILARVYFYTQNWSALWKLLRGPLGARLALKRINSHRYFKPKDLSANLAGFRYQLLRVLACLPDDRWVRTEELFRVMRLVWPRFDQTAWQTYHRPSATGSWYLAESGSGASLNPRKDMHWHLAQGNFVQEVISGPLHWLGLSDLSLDDGSLVAFRLHGLADLFWDRVESAPAPSHARARSDALALEDAVDTQDLTITVYPSAVSAQVHSLLERIAHLETATAERFVYRLDARSAHAAFEAGVTLTEILQDWEQLMPLPISSEIKTRLDDWWTAYSRVRIYQDLTVIELGDDYTLEELKAVTSLSDHLIAEISPRFVIVSKKAMAPLMSEMEKAGYTPKQTDAV